MQARWPWGYWVGVGEGTTAARRPWGRRRCCWLAGAGRVLRDAPSACGTAASPAGQAYGRAPPLHTLCVPAPYGKGRSGQLCSERLRLRGICICTSRVCARVCLCVPVCVCTRLFLHLTRLFVCFCTYTHLCMCLCMLCTHRCLHTRAREGGTGSRVRHSCRWWGCTLRPCWDGRYSVLCVSGRGFAMAFRPRALGCTEEPGPRVGAGPALCRPSSQEAAWLCPGQRPLPSCGRAVQPPGESRGDGRAPSPLRVSGPRSRAGPPSGGAG